MKGLIPFNRKSLNSFDTGIDDFYNVLDDFFSGSLLPSRNLSNDTFKIDVQETDKEFLIEAEMPGIKKEEISLDLNDDRLTISIKREENIEDNNKNFVHRERRYCSMSRSVYLANSKLDDIKAKLENGVLTVKIQKKEKAVNSHKIDIE